MNGTTVIAFPRDEGRAVRAERERYPLQALRGFFFVLEVFDWRLFGRMLFAMLFVCRLPIYGGCYFSFLSPRGLVVRVWVEGGFVRDRVHVCAS